MIILIPYVHKFAQRDELKFTLRSIETHYKGEYRVMIVGDLPQWCCNIEHLPHDRHSIGAGSNLNDAILKMYKALEHLDGDFIRWYDDILLLKDSSLDDLNKHWVQQDLNKHARKESSVYLRQLWATYDECRAHNLYGYNCEVHLPRVFNAFLLKHVLDKHIKQAAGLKLLLMQSLYFNTYGGTVVRLHKGDDIKAGYYGMDDLYSYPCPARPQEVDAVLKNKRFLNYNDKGCNEVLWQWITNKFNTKSKFEK